MPIRVVQGGPSALGGKYVDITRYQILSSSGDLGESQDKLTAKRKVKLYVSIFLSRSR